MDLFFCTGIKSGSWLVEHQDRRITDECPGNRDPGFLTTRKKLPTLPAWRIVSGWHLHDKVVSISVLGRLFYFLLGWILFAKTNVDANWQVKENDVFGVRGVRSGAGRIRTTD